MDALAVKYRPKAFDDVCDQESIKKILTKQIETGQVKNTYLFCGASGCGKTTIARIFANEINGGVGSPIEMDAASNSGVESIRQISEDAEQRSITSKYKVYIIDECHALSNQAWQAFLKTIEEPPQFSIFIFCTTDPQKIPMTILNRVMRFNFNRIGSNKIRERLSYICKQENFTNYEETCDYISKICSGQMRDGIALLEKCADYSTDLVINNVLEALGNYSYDVMFDLLYAMFSKDIGTVSKILTDLYNKGSDMKLFIDKYLEFCLDLAKYAVIQNMASLKIPSSLEDRVKTVTTFQGADTSYYYVIDRLLELKNMLKNDTEPFTTIQVMMIRIARWQ